VPAPQLTPEEFGREIGRAARGGLGIAILILAILTVVIAVISGAEGGRPSFPLLIPLLIVGAILIARAWTTAVTLRTSLRPAPGLLRIGETFTWGMRVRALRPVEFEPAELVIRCREHAIRQAGKSTAHHRRTVWEQVYRIELPGGRLAPGEEWDVGRSVAIPEGAIPTYRPSHDRIEWTAEITVKPSGFCSTIRERIELVVLPRIEETGHPQDPQVPLKWLAQAPILDEIPGRVPVGGLPGDAQEGLRGISAVGDGLVASLEMPEGVMTGAGPVIPVGTTRQLVLKVEAQEKTGCRGLDVWVGCRVGAPYPTEGVVLFPQSPVYEGELLPGQPVSVPVSLTAPPGGPVSFTGERVRYHWLVRVRAPMALWRDKVLELPFIVSPEAVPPRP
jgi:hypothetical protein